ncbi:hypothetical protein [Candidatus Neoehrlichia procyonis]|uniref:Uncharacterized protein n=1 Tax=Candidatus Neoehrlichia procyonis str. RAC413 TaxID=1359163 RepID=A0A0F3NM73_9RICK|nr:hypothetical protein [Candidatus Neoehrlichia lotoris]KJV68881.1 hypothetical protein NLO413_0250 [Candidatus Neoehrlichia lotoris str. RAC413]
MKLLYKKKITSIAKEVANIANICNLTKQLNENVSFLSIEDAHRISQMSPGARNAVIDSMMKLLYKKKITSIAKEVANIANICNLTKQLNENVSFLSIEDAHRISQMSPGARNAVIDSMMKLLYKKKITSIAKEVAKIAYIYNHVTRRPLNNKNQIIPDNVPILMFWMVKNISLLKNDHLPLPDNDKYPYKQRLLNWAKKEPQRQIKLYYVSTGLKEQHLQKLYDLTNPNKGGEQNIQVIDFNAKFSKKFGCEYLHNNKIPFTWKIDIARIIMLIEDAPAIYIDFDILPSDTQIGHIIMNNIGYMSSFSQDILFNKIQMENSIIIIDSKDHYILHVVHEVIRDFLDYNSSTLIYYKKNIELHSNLFYQLIKFIRFFTNQCQYVKCRPFLQHVYIANVIALMFAYNYVKHKVEPNVLFKIIKLFSKVKEYLYCNTDKYNELLLTVINDINFEKYFSCNNKSFNITMDLSWNASDNALYNTVNSVVCNTKKSDIFNKDESYIINNCNKLLYNKNNDSPLPNTNYNISNTTQLSTCKNITL